MSNTQKTTAKKSTQKPAEDTTFDLDKLESETRHEPFVFTFGGRQWTVPHLRDIDHKVLTAADQGDQQMAREALRLGLGDDEYEKFQKIPLSLHGFDELFGRWLDHSGLQRGNSRASTDS